MNGWKKYFYFNNKCTVFITNYIIYSSSTESVYNDNLQKSSYLNSWLGIHLILLDYNLQSTWRFKYSSFLEL